MNRRQFLNFTMAGTAGCLMNAQQRQPNFLIIYADDMGIGDLGCYGARDMKTPHLDRLAASGVRFTDWYSNSPVCSPSRASLLTGKYPQKTGIPKVLTSAATFNVPGLKKEEVTISGELKKRGYRTGHIGKWHLGSAAQSRPSAQGYDEFFGFYSGWTDYYSHRYYRQGGAAQDIFHDLWRNETEEFRDGEYHTEVFASEAISFISKQSSKPFFLTLAFGSVHYPMMAPEKYLSRFPKTMDRERRMHAAVAAAMDDAVGEVIESLSQLGQLENTVIFFQSDNGATSEVRAHSQALPYRGGSNAPYRGFKAGLFEGGIRMPAMMSWKNHIPANQKVSGMGGAMDIFPTFLTWAGVPASEIPAVDGKSVVEMVQKNASSPHQEFYWAYLKQRAIREENWKLILHPPSVPGDEVKADVWLSNLAEDPGEKINYASREPQRVKALREKINQWEATLPAAMLE